MDLRADNVTVRFGGLCAIDDVSLTLPVGGLLGLIGPNGAGKTTLINVLSGFQAPDSGRVLVAGRDAGGRPPDWFARNGVVRTFQAVRLYRGLTVSENIEVGFANAGISRHAARQQAAALLEAMQLADKADWPASVLSYGDERRVGIARALAMRPRFLLLDEPAAGLNIGEAEELSALIARIRAEYGCGVLVIEHNMKLVMSLCPALHVLANGQTIATGSPAEVQANAAFRTAYLGTEAA